MQGYVWGGYLFLMLCLAWLIWDPDPDFFTLPYLNHPITWYGLLFATGFLLGYFCIRTLFRRHLMATHFEGTESAVRLAAMTLADRIMLLVVIGTVVGSRLGHVFFYGWPYYREHVGEIFRVWKGGLASHGGAIGILLLLILFVVWSRRRFKTLTFLATLDALVVPTALVGGMIRIGNFINQEILGKPTDLPWGVIFLHPVGGERGIPLHPVQLYEALFYFATFAFLWVLWWTKEQKLGRGFLSGWFFLLVFGFRFVIEFFKLPQTLSPASEEILTMGQMLSIPFIFVGIALLIYAFCKRRSYV